MCEVLYIGNIRDYPLLIYPMMISML